MFLASWQVLKTMPPDSHPMTMLTTAIQSMQVDSLLPENMMKVFPKQIIGNGHWKMGYV
ncbi:MAG: hypothetical protein Ct9H300mP29_6130 [Candidatus Neomarinimicrobiota bacterium]|nr:MAG: hypothetical protein Ct9H300mP29_6130 [Candidatus Neomarinimicrobiota bacterium]